MKTRVKTRLVAGTINSYSENGWHVISLDVSNRPIYDSKIKALVQPDVVADLGDELPMFPDETFDEVVAHHVLEHLLWDRGTLALRALFRILKPGGVLDIEVPDIDRIVQAHLGGKFDLEELQQWLFGEDLGEKHEYGDSHRSIYNEETLRAKLVKEGFEVGEREETGLALRLIARKPK